MNGDNLKKANEELHRINHANQDLYKSLKNAIKEKDDLLIEKIKTCENLAKALNDKNNTVQEYTQHIEKQEFD